MLHRHITKQGSRWLRWILIETAIHAVKRPGLLRRFYFKVERKKGGPITKVATAKKLVGKGGLEPPRLAAHDPKSCSSANSDTPPDRKSPNTITFYQTCLKPSGLKRNPRAFRRTIAEGEFGSIIKNATPLKG